MKNYKKNRRKQITVIVIVAMLLLGIGYAALTTVLKIHTNITLKKVEFAIHFDNVGTLSNTADVNTEAAIIDDPVKREIMFNAQLNRIDDYYAFTTDIVNEGSIPGVIKSIEIQGITDSQKKLLKFDVTYTDSNKEMKIGDFLGPNSSKNITFKATYFLADDINDDDLPDDDLPLEGIFVINFENGSLDVYRARAAASKLMQNTQYMNSNALNFERPATSSEYSGAYILAGTENNDFPIYFYRGGSSTANHLIFSDMCWRIIRTTNTGGIKIIYNGRPTEQGQCLATGADTLTTNLSFNEPYPGSNLKTYLESWYFANIIKNQAYVEDTTYCNKTYGAGDISLDCGDYGYSVANGKNSYPVGLITAQEENLCGNYTTAGAYSTSYHWLFTGKEYWTMSRIGTPGYSAWCINTDGRIGDYPATFDIGKARGVRPVISLNSEVELYDGDGTKENPYKVRLG